MRRLAGLFDIVSASLYEPKPVIPQWALDEARTREMTGADMQELVSRVPPIARVMDPKEMFPCTSIAKECAAPPRK